MESNAFDCCCDFPYIGDDYGWGRNSNNLEEQLKRLQKYIADHEDEANDNIHYYLQIQEADREIQALKFYIQAKKCKKPCF